jgi:two-component system phosphate regulon response regulator PhoB
VEISRLIQHSLRAAGFTTQSFPSSQAVIPAAVRERPSLFLLDVMLPGGETGFDLCRRIRRLDELSSTPVIFLTARTAEEDRIRGLELGGDDYIVKPFSPRELVARIRRVLRSAGTSESGTIRVGDLEIDPSSMTILLQGQPVACTVKEFRLLEYLASHPGRVFSRQQLLDAVWKEIAFVTPRSIDVYVRRLREKIERDEEHPRYIKTLRGIGYRFDSAGDIPLGTKS